jgi:Zn-finger nucleic acid-binding protein
MEVSDVEEALERKYGDPEYSEGTVENYMRCPRCEGRLHKFNYTYGSAVHIDRCGSCFGIWLDDGELDAIIGRKQKMEEDFDISKMKVFMRSVGRSIKDRD